MRWPRANALVRDAVAAAPGPRVVGIDPSLRATAAVLLAPTWRPGDWTMPVERAGYDLQRATPLQLAERLHVIAERMVSFVRVHRATHVFIEDYAFGMAGSSNAITLLAELGGGIKVELFGQLGLAAVPVNQSTVRKYFLGKLPPKDRAAAVHTALRRVGAPWATSDPGDAFLVASFGRSELGLPGMTLAPPG